MSEQYPSMPLESEIPQNKYDSSVIGAIGEVAGAVSAAITKLPGDEIQQASTHIKQAATIINETVAVSTSSVLAHAEEATQASAGHAGVAGYHLNVGASNMDTYLQALGTGVDAPKKYHIPAEAPDIIEHMKMTDIHEPPETIYMMASYESSSNIASGKTPNFTHLSPKILLDIKVTSSPNFFKNSQITFSTPLGESLEETPAEPLAPNITPASYFETVPRTPTAKERVDQKLLGGFSEAARALDLNELAVINEGSRRPRNLGDFGIIPIESQYPVTESLQSIGWACTIPGDVRVTYGTLGEGRPYLDTSLALGLIKADRNAEGELTGTSWLIAVAAAGVDGQGNVVIRQIQDVTDKAGKSTPEDPKARFKTGLHSGFAWRDTLVTAWETVASTTRASSRVVIQSAAKNNWPSVCVVPEGSTDGRPQGYNGYDAVAKRLGYTPILPSGNWAKTLPTPEATEGDEPSAENSESEAA